jgi:hypothetical protein
MQRSIISHATNVKKGLGIAKKACKLKKTVIESMTVFFSALMLIILLIGLFFLDVPKAVRIAPHGLSAGLL